MPRLITLIVALLFGGLFSQAPEFQQQYRQRLGGAIDEMARAIDRFNADARALGLTPDAAIERLASNPDELARRRADAEIEIISRRDRLERQRRVFETENVIARLTTLASDYDQQLAYGTWQAFRPAVPTTIDGAAAGLFGAGIGLFLVVLATLTSHGIRRRWRRRHTAYKA
jgi:CRP-like cAMP-binding protein